MESTFDGMVLEISISGSVFQDIITAGGSFVAGGGQRRRPDWQWDRD